MFFLYLFIFYEFQNSLRELDRKLETEYKKELELIYTDIEAKNKVLLLVSG